MGEILERSWVEIDLSAFRHNLRALKSFLTPEQGFIQIVKADAYGHGAAQIARVAISEGAAALGVANLEEGKLLRIQGFTEPVIILSPSLSSEIKGILDYHLIPSISDISFASELSKAAKEQDLVCSVHLKLDSGMHRSGALEAEFISLWQACKELPNIEVQGVFSHFASGESDPDFSYLQEQTLHRVLQDNGIDAPWVHLANSSALVNGHGSTAGYCRLGILSFGVYTHPSQADKLKLMPVMTFKSQISQLKTISMGESVGYNLTWQAPRDTRYAIIPVGYADGYDFLLSNRGMVLVGKSVCPVIGKVSMDMLCVDVTDVPTPAIGTEVILLGGSFDALRSENLTASYGGSPYELLSQVGRRAKRFYFEDGTLVTSSPLSRRDFVSSDYSDSQLGQIIQSALAQRINSEEMGELISREILRVFFFNKDREILYRKDFRHHISFEEGTSDRFFRANTTLSFRKVLQNDYFIVACANSEEALQSYFKRRDVEYRWLMDTNFDLSAESFALSSVRIDGLALDTELHYRDNCMEIRCSHPSLSALVGREVQFSIDTATLYPRESHQLSVFITEMTHGVQISFSHPGTLTHIECIPVFSGQNKYPIITRTPGSITVATKSDEWVFPLSGVVFAY